MSDRVSDDISDVLSCILSSWAGFVQVDLCAVQT